jgi:hypothetical protein
MKIPVDLWLRGEDSATTETMDLPIGEPEHWTDEDVRLVLREMLRAMYRQRYPDREERETVGFRGVSWIVNDYEHGGVVIAVEITLGAAIAGPIAVDKPVLSKTESRGSWLSLLRCRPPPRACTECPPSSARSRLP